MLLFCFERCGGLLVGLIDQVGSQRRGASGDGVELSLRQGGVRLGRECAPDARAFLVGPAFPGLGVEDGGPLITLPTGVVFFR